MATSTSINAQVLNIENPRFYNEPHTGNLLHHVMTVSFGWFKTLDNEQREAYHSSIVVALEEAQPGQFSRWYKNNASGMVRVAWQEPRNGSICKRLHVSIIAHGMIKEAQSTACFNEVDNRWSWY